MNAPSKGAEKPQYVVARGRTVHIDGKAVGPGEPVSGLSASDLDYLLVAGFVAKAAAEDANAGIKVGGLQIKGGRRPAGTIA
ncbi:hypothetical protein [Burkholderia pseudomallei]|uniref:hypothetical protein n=1 Tax=Burkholderia pseudomallei TaxID=28450 RepID=UPI000978110C|nr:hypothetical protein [Burkholderia pseudomallei]OMQ57078.1 hypothetical protein AQ709_26615 [Burkholderia pseudomallei]OMQ65144.1 hypothetical protein AQ712_13025 [Burkholderia pseudomallei]OMQ72875.1 hypothetical protein AQ711_02485 [Burkholderia pseudomallei]CAJ2714658.1 Uncharacterised protein [Burkholderia pseudomallei]CAJ4671489.1 Uncharacterised protein [Burkholderia pseudomallei]